MAQKPMDNLLSPPPPFTPSPKAIAAKAGGVCDFHGESFQG